MEQLRDGAPANCVDVDLGRKDLVLPRKMNVLLNWVIEAQKKAEASVILREVETVARR